MEDGIFQHGHVVVCGNRVVNHKKIFSSKEAAQSFLEECEKSASNYFKEAAIISNNEGVIERTLILTTLHDGYREHGPDPDIPHFPNRAFYKLEKTATIRRRNRLAREARIEDGRSAAAEPNESQMASRQVIDDWHHYEWAIEDVFYDLAKGAQLKLKGTRDDGHELYQNISISQRELEIFDRGRDYVARHERKQHDALAEKVRVRLAAADFETLQNVADVLDGKTPFATVRR